MIKILISVLALLLLSSCGHDDLGDQRDALYYCIQGIPAYYRLLEYSRAVDNCQEQLGYVK